MIFDNYGVVYFLLNKFSIFVLEKIVRKVESVLFFIVKVVKNNIDY